MAVNALLVLTSAAFVAFADMDTINPVNQNSVSTAIVAAAVTPDSATVGDVLSLEIMVSAESADQRALLRSAATVIVPPDAERDFGGFVVLSSSIEEGEAGTVYRYNLTTFRPQTCTIPSLRFLVNKGFSVDTLFTDPIPITIISVIPADAADAEGGLAIMGLKAQQKTGGADIRSLWILLLIALAVLAYYLLGKYARKKSGEHAPAVPLKPPYEEAIEAIEKLESKKLLEQGNIKEYVFDLSEIFKRYIGRRYDTIASELTTEEIVAWLEFSGISFEMRLCAERFLRTGDQVKFAKWKPDQETIDSFMKDVRTFLEATKPDPQLQYEQKTERMGAVE
jgi:hypothetical protein